METLKVHSGPFVERYHYAPEEFEAIATDELRAAGLLPSAPEPIRVDRFIEKRFDTVPQYDALPDGIIGFTRFGAEGPIELVVSRALADDGGQAAERRISSTLAHEAGHVLLHGQLFALQLRNPTRRLLQDDVDVANQRVLCRDDNNGTRRYDGRWWEYQANQMIGALLMPRPLVHQALESVVTLVGLLGIPILVEERRQEAVLSLAETFNVNPVVARIRIGQIYPEAEGRQLPL